VEAKQWETHDHCLIVVLSEKTVNFQQGWCNNDEMPIANQRHPATNKETAKTVN
jgi:hypothetical protein